MAGLHVFSEKDSAYNLHISKGVREMISTINVPDISGAWKSKDGQKVYTITQVGDHFVWRVLHRGGVMETGLGWFPKITEEEEGKIKVEAQWNFDSGRTDAGVRMCPGEVIIQEGKVVEIHWKDRDDFYRLG